MLEVKVNVVITAPELAGAINNLAVAINGKAQSTFAVQQNVPVSTPVNPIPTPSQTVPEQPSGSVQQSAAFVQRPTMPVAAVPLANAPQFTVDQIMAAGATLMDAGKVDDLLSLLRSFGVQAVMELKPEQLGAFATEMRKLGAAI